MEGAGVVSSETESATGCASAGSGCGGVPDTGAAMGWDSCSVLAGARAGASIGTMTDGFGAATSETGATGVRVSATGTSGAGGAGTAAATGGAGRTDAAIASTGGAGIRDGDWRSRRSGDLLNGRGCGCERNGSSAVGGACDESRCCRGRLRWRWRLGNGFGDRRNRLDCVATGSRSGRSPLELGDVQAARKAWARSESLEPREELEIGKWLAESAGVSRA